VKRKALQHISKKNGTEKIIDQKSKKIDAANNQCDFDKSYFIEIKRAKQHRGRRIQKENKDGQRFSQKREYLYCIVLVLVARIVHI
jgi:hypothetical protein